MENKDNDLTKDDLLECSSLIHAKILELQCSLESLKVTLNKLEETHYKEDETLKNAKELYETVLEECEKYSKLYKKLWIYIWLKGRLKKVWVKITKRKNIYVHSVVIKW